MAMPDGEFPSTGADAKPSPHDSYGIIRHQGWTPAILTHLSLLNERFLLFQFFKNLKIILNKNFYFKYRGQLADRASARIFHGYAAGWKILFDIGLVKHAFRTPY